MPIRPHRPTLLVVGCGDVGLRVVRRLRGRCRIIALTSSEERMPVLRAAGAVPMLGDLDDPPSLARLGSMADAVLHLAPPPSTGDRDSRTTALLRALARGGRTRRIVYGSTTGVYGDCGSARIDETRAVRPATDRARRRVEAERQLRRFGRDFGVTVTILRIPGIYAADRPGGARDRLLRGTPVLAPPHDVHTNHVHAEDLARACIAALFRGRPQRVVHASDDTDLTIGQYLDQAAELFGLPRPPRIGREEAEQVLSPMQRSFMAESRRLDNRRLRRELKLRLLYPTVATGLRA